MDTMPSQQCSASDADGIHLVREEKKREKKKRPNVCYLCCLATTFFFPHLEQSTLKQVIFTDNLRSRSLEVNYVNLVCRGNNLLPNVSWA